VDCVAVVNVAAIFVDGSVVTVLTSLPQPLLLLLAEDGDGEEDGPVTETCRMA